MPGPLAGLRVLELARILAGPWAGQILADLGYAPGPIDGTLGDETERAVSAFQRDRKIAQNGRITPELLREIKRVTGRDLSATASRP